MESEDELVSAAQRGDPAAAESLVVMFWDRVFGFAFRLSRNRIDAEDIAQETFLKAFEGLHTHEPRGMFKAWLLRIATNIFLDQRREAKIQEMASSELALSSRTVGLGADAQVDQKELAQAVWQAVSKLTKEQKVVIMLRSVEEMAYSQIGEILGIKEGAARWHMYVARRLLSRKLGRILDPKPS